MLWKVWQGSIKYGLPYDVDLGFTVHKLIVEIDEDGHVHYDEEKH